MFLIFLRHALVVLEEMRFCYREVRLFVMAVCNGL